MPVVNSVGNVLTRVTRTGSFVGLVNPTLSQLKISAIAGSTGIQVCSVAPGASAVNRISMSSQATGQNVLFGLAETDTNLRRFICQ